MGRLYPPSPRTLSLLFLLFVSSFAASSEAAATSTRLAQKGWPGFLFTRTRGRCTPLYWSSRNEAWPRMVPQEATLSKVFGWRASERYRSDLTLLEATARKDEENAFHRLLKQGTASLLNSYARKGFPYSAWEIKTLVLQALVSEEAAVRQAQGFSVANEACS
ncbi:uncharacterized protein LOC121252842 [Juglans microcarpa x Juglans regia]|uniref:uncharacterized protein LOC121252842 n=1 Tax=Juglans microcarpa x Juglans regia TaxID=2249226 RepID=UPI001B7DB44D|nr:uncharacterized protein LOC121252842 [Juglans microcarpa x Juglans regia]